MIVGIGTDLCRIARMAHATQNEHFVRRIFSAEEIAYASGQGNPAMHYASAYAAKEALAKASGLGMFGMGIDASWVERTETGPEMHCTGALWEKLQAKGVKKIWLSLTHEGDYALAFVVLES
ncbi:holo-ACP synthase [Synergistaceae bacterium OttesenSCG-928-I11]|nr:holo-ACP synthase [Synergistaceae bacterium OttesenSCG-928-I11]